jgi:hypothetical protein
MVKTSTQLFTPQLDQGKVSLNTATHQLDN